MSTFRASCESLTRFFTSAALDKGGELCDRAGVM